MTVDLNTIQHMTRNEADMAFKKRVQTIFEWLPPGDDKRILDCACGRGFYLNMYRYVSEGQLVGLELEADIIHKAQQNVGHLPDITLTRGDLYALPFPDDYFDGVILSEVLEHLDDDRAGLREVWRVLKPGAVVAITVPHAKYPFWWDPINKTLETLFGTRIRRGPLAGIWANHVRLYERDELRAAVEEAGFEVEAERSFTHYCFPFIHNLVYGLGKPLLESGRLPQRMATAADRTTFDQNRGSLLNPINLGVAILNRFDRRNVIDEPPERSTVNLAIKGRKPMHPILPEAEAVTVDDARVYSAPVGVIHEAPLPIGDLAPAAEEWGYTPTRETEPFGQAFPAPPPDTLIFEDLTLGQALGYLFWRPARTARLFWRVLTRDPDVEARRQRARIPTPASVDEIEPAARPVRERRVPEPARPAPAVGEMSLPIRPRLQIEFATGERVAWGWIAMLAMVFLLAVWGGTRLHDAALDPEKNAAGNANGAFILFLYAGTAYVSFRLAQTRDWWAAQFPRMTAWLQRRFYSNDMPYVWTVGLGTIMTILFALGLMSPGGLWGTAILFVAAAGVFLMILLGNRTSTPSPDRTPVPVEYAFPLWNFLLAAGVILVMWALSVRAAWWLVAWIASGAVIGGIGTPVVCRYKQRRPQIGTVIGVLIGAIGNLVLLVGLWVVILLQPDGDQAAPAITTGVPMARMRRRAQTVRQSFWPWFQAHIHRLVLMPVALLLSALAYSENVVKDRAGNPYDVEFTTGGFAAWVLSVIVWIVILGVDVRRLPERLRALDHIEWSAWRERLRRIRVSWPVVALVVITILGAYFRLHDLSSTPPEMTSDHIEKLLDVMRVQDGYRGVFFPNNGGREGFQMYFVALIADVFDVGLSFDALKLATVIEGVLTLPALWWMARQLFGDETERDRRLGDWVGVALAGLVAISSWHVMLSRLGLRIALTPLTTAVVIGFVARVMRHNRTWDYIGLGVTLGAGVYFYQANRMLPILVLIGIALALLGQVHRPRDLWRLGVDVFGFGALVLAPVLIIWYFARLFEQSAHSNVHDFGDRLSSLLPLLVMLWFSILALMARTRRDESMMQYGSGLLMVIVVALAIYIPMYRYSEIRPDDFWNRTRGRMFGEEAFVRTDSAGNVVAYDPTLGEQAERFWDQRDVFRQNLQDALRMYHWQGDGGFISNANSRPAMGALTGGLLILGLVMWGVRLFEQPDPVNWLPLFSILVMLLPSALTLAYTIENPSFTRASGSLPGVFLLAAFPLGMFCWRLVEMPSRMRYVPVGTVAALAVLGSVLWNGLGPNWDNFFTYYRLNYSYSWSAPYHEIAKPLREFAQSEQGSYGNAFYLHYKHWLDHRILGAMAGDIRWPNGMNNDPENGRPVTLQAIIDQMARNRGTPYAFDPTKQLFFMYHPKDKWSPQFLAESFPGGTTELYEYRYEAQTPGNYVEGSFYIYRVWADWIEIG